MTQESRTEVLADTVAAELIGCFSVQDQVRVLGLIKEKMLEYWRMELRTVETERDKLREHQSYLEDLIERVGGAF